MPHELALVGIYFSPLLPIVLFEATMQSKNK